MNINRRFSVTLSNEEISRIEHMSLDAATKRTPKDLIEYIEELVEESFFKGYAEASN